MIYLSDEPANPNFIGRMKYSIGDKVRIVKVTLTVDDGKDTKDVLTQSLGRIFEIADVCLWANDDPDDPWHLNYQIDVTDRESIFLNDDEIEWISKGKMNKPTLDEFLSWMESAPSEFAQPNKGLLREDILALVAEIRARLTPEPNENDL